MDKSSIVVITGANSGIGKATSIELAKTGAVIIMLCRNKERGEEALQDVRELSENNSVAETAIYLATSGDVERVSGKYFYRKRSVPSSKRSYDKATAKKLWDLSKKMVELEG